MKHIFTLNDNNVVQTLLSAPQSLEFTLQFWIQMEGSGALFKYHKNQDKAFLLDVNEQGKLLLTHVAEGSARSVETIRGGIADKSWKHVSITEKDDALSLFVNGKLIPCRQITGLQTTTKTPQKAENSTCLIIGDPTKQSGSSLQGLLADIKLWDKALTLPALQNYKQQETKLSKASKANGLLYSYTRSTPKTLTAVATKKEEIQTARIELTNNSPFELSLLQICGASDSAFPDKLLANATTIIDLSALHEFNEKASYTCKSHSDDPLHNAYQNNINLNIDVNKSLIAYESWVKVEVSPLLQREVTPQPLPNELAHPEQAYNQLHFGAKVSVSENLVIVNAKNLNKCITDMLDGTEVSGEKLPGLASSQIVKNLNYCQDSGEASSTGEQIIKYNQSCQLFNRRVQKKPLAIIYCESAEQVQVAYLAATKNNLPISVRSGGHDHEGECSDTNTILIDLMGLSGVDVNPNNLPEGITSDPLLAEIGAGNRFITLTTALADEGVMIPHGTCATVAIPGFIMGGGWGPWTRKYGMCCEHLVGAEIILGDGTKEVISASNKPNLLWALKGGGGMSYGIVTKFYIQTFELPESMIKFELEWNQYDSKDQKFIDDTNTLDILRAWEKVVASSATDALQGTNLKINGKPYVPPFCYKNVKHNCVMYGYFKGTEEQLDNFIEIWFTSPELKTKVKRIDGIGGLGTDYGKQLMGSWDRESFLNVQRALAGESNLPLPPDLDEPAPHKITSRLVTTDLGGDGYRALLSSLTSPLILEGSRDLGLFSYVTLGAIDGQYYKRLLVGEKVADKGLVEDDKGQSAFPYKASLYTIQYQTWWNIELEQKEQLQDSDVYTRTNRALDWMEVCRDVDIPNTSGAFISFKDDSIPTETYFGKNYEKLKEIKQCYSQDGFNHLRKRKTII
ncbi:MAG: hypothetical protein ACJAV1_003177 [Paraglaciecola sp.]|jgi:hypothetical protein